MKSDLSSVRDENLEDHKSFKDRWPRHHGLESGVQSPLYVGCPILPLDGLSAEYQFVYTAQVIVLFIYSSMREEDSPVMFLVHIFHIFQQSSLRSFRFHPRFLATFFPIHVDGQNAQKSHIFIPSQPFSNFYWLFMLSATSSIQTSCSHFKITFHLSLSHPSTFHSHLNFSRHLVFFEA